MGGPGIFDSRRLPDRQFSELWEAIIIDADLKDRLLAHAVLNFTLRPKISRAKLPLHGVILLAGVPGTGKTSLAKGLASRAADVLGTITYLEIDPHSLTSAALGKSQKAVTELGARIAEFAGQRKTIVLLDEVETLVSDRAKLSLEANPVDVHRATDAALVQLDHLAAEFPQLLFIATSNFPQAIDAAFISRADFVLTVPLPNEQAIREILTSTLTGLGDLYPPVKRLTADASFSEIVRACVGLDGRQLRKLVASACTFDKQTALDPSRLTITDLRRAAAHVQSEAKISKGGSK
jgi:SpoVK/Ycf46/Vps4 family AAA+-type ATPase